MTSSDDLAVDASAEVTMLIYAEGKCAHGDHAGGLDESESRLVSLPDCSKAF